MKLEKILFAGHGERSEKRAIKTKCSCFPKFNNHIYRETTNTISCGSLKKKNCLLVELYFPREILVNYHSENSKGELLNKEIKDMATLCLSICL